MSERRGMVIHFMDGTNISFDFPEQITDKASMARKVERILDMQYIVMEAEGAVLLYPVTNIKSIQLYPAPDTLPEFVVKGATIRS